jgi:hypothetical protein
MTLKFTRSLFGAIANRWFRTAAVAVMALTFVGAGLFTQHAMARDPNPCAGFHISPLTEHFSWLGTTSGPKGELEIDAGDSCYWLLSPINNNGMFNASDFSPAKTSGVGGKVFSFSVNPNYGRTALTNYIRVTPLPNPGYANAAPGTLTVTQAAYGHN